MMSAPVARTSAGRIAFTVAAVPTGMKAGVRISPRIMRMTPVRAAPSVAASRNANLSVMVRAYGRSGAESRDGGDKAPPLKRRGKPVLLTSILAWRLIGGRPDHSPTLSLLQALQNVGWGQNDVSRYKYEV